MNCLRLSTCGMFFYIYILSLFLLFVLTFEALTVFPLFECISLRKGFILERGGSNNCIVCM
jgi:hypothetical protein